MHVLNLKSKFIKMETGTQKVMFFCMWVYVLLSVCLILTCLTVILILLSIYSHFNVVSSLILPSHYALLSFFSDSFQLLALPKQIAFHRIPPVPALPVSMPCLP